MLSSVCDLRTQCFSPAVKRRLAPRTPRSGPCASEVDPSVPSSRRQCCNLVSLREVRASRRLKPLECTDSLQVPSERTPVLHCSVGREGRRWPVGGRADCPQTTHPPPTPGSHCPLSPSALPWKREPGSEASPTPGTSTAPGSGGACPCALLPGAPSPVIGTLLPPFLFGTLVGTAHPAPQAPGRPFP